MIINRQGFSLLELIITSSMIAIIVVSAGHLLLVTYRVLNQEYTRLSIRQGAAGAFDLISTHFRHIYSIDNISDSSLEYTMTDSVGGNKSYRLYLHNENDLDPNPPYSETSYDLRLTDTLEYGDGQILIRNIAQPSSSVFNQSGGMIAIDLTVALSGQSMRFRTNVSARNLL